LQYTLDFIDKLQNRNLSAKSQIELANLKCKLSPLSDLNPISACSASTIHTSDMHRQWPWAKTLLVESFPLVLDSSETKSISTHASYHWTLLSNSHKPFHFYGTYSQFIQQAAPVENLVDGTCDGFSANIDDFSALSRAVIFFSNECQRRPQEPATKSSLGSWISEHKILVYSIGAIVVGGAIYALKDNYSLDGN